ncbi:MULTISPECIES: NF038129 family PEP-CTERM protein [unclassified Massilia]|uniref:NF038129 family PEP-CTERM protein n=1 Tax=unclassified Massilia TaxID=2609279 RepID=UPI0017827A2C|nr:MULTISPECIES: NF038129 family PEP-CTERM protein [unclassified Massilia]MBD8531250.1 NF038129 family PEP-CTERM protein [Massilia sp. CFBP 13647]MBD8676487.1 NF038129 family PEP-CTERM protein [Massilia sp. CFBP 13721]
MFNLKNLFTRALLALMLVTGAGAASAGPTYHVTIDTTSLSGTGFLDFLFSGDANSSGPATATVSNFSGNGTGVTTYGDVTPTATGAIFDNVNGFAEALIGVNLGGLFNFDLSFDVAPAGDGTTFSFALLNPTQDGYLGVDGDLAQFQLMPGSDTTVSSANALTSIALVSEVPEPATMASLMFGLALMGSTLRARRK